MHAGLGEGTLRHTNGSVACPRNAEKQRSAEKERRENVTGLITGEMLNAWVHLLT